MIAYDPDTHREPTEREHSDACFDGALKRGDRVCMVGTDLYGTVKQGTLYVGQDRPLVQWDTITAEEGAQSWISPDFLVLVAVPR